MQAFVSATLGYSLYYVCRTSLNVMKKPVLDSGSLDASQLGVIGSALLFAYAVGKFVNGFIADYCNIKRFMATGLIVSAAANALMGLLGLAHSVVPTTVIFVAFAVMWGLNGWAQSMGAPPAIISLSRWYPLNERGTYYGFFSASHNLGEFFSFLFVGSIVTFAGWQAGFFGSALAGAIGVLVVLCWLHDTPESKGLPPVEALAHEKPVPGAEKVRPGDSEAGPPDPGRLGACRGKRIHVHIPLCNQRMGRTVPAGGQGILGRRGNLHRLDKRPLWEFSERCFRDGFRTNFFRGDRKIPALIFGVLNSVALALFLYGGNAMWVNVLSMVLFGIAIGVLICFPRRVDGRGHRAPEGYRRCAGVVGIASYCAAGIQDVASGWLIDKHITVAADGVKHYDFGPVAFFWIAASVISFILPLLNRRRSE